MSRGFEEGAGFDKRSRFRYHSTQLRAFERVNNENFSTPKRIADTSERFAQDLETVWLILGFG